MPDFLTGVGLFVCFFHFIKLVIFFFLNKDSTNDLIENKPYRGHI